MKKPPTPAQLAKRNAAFQRLSPIAKRRAIGRDVLERLATKQLCPEHNGYVQLDTYVVQDLQQQVDAGRKCYCCAVGGAAIALAHFEDKMKTDSYGKLELCFGANTERSRLTEILGAELMALIESAYEGYVKHNGRGLDTERNLLSDSQVSDAIDFYCRYRLPRNRFKAIWSQIASTGTFDPSL